MLWDCVLLTEEAEERDRGLGVQYAEHHPPHLRNGARDEAVRKAVRMAASVIDRCGSKCKMGVRWV